MPGPVDQQPHHTSADTGFAPPHVRRFGPGDEAEVYRVCVLTGNSGGDATGLFEREDLLPDIFAGPYLALEPDLAFVVDTGDHIAGYLLATADTRSFVERYRTGWLPRFAAMYPVPLEPVTAEDRLVSLGHDPAWMLGPDLDAFPAHLHIDLLPELQGQGFGRKLIRMLLGILRERGVPGVHLGVGEENAGARAFYARLGFRPLPSAPDDELLLGIRTSAAV